MKRILAAALATALFASPALADRDWHRHRDRGSSSSRILDAAITLSILGLITQGAQQQSYAPQRSLKDPYYQPYVPGDPYPPARPLK